MRTILGAAEKTGSKKEYCLHNKMVSANDTPLNDLLLDVMRYTGL
jgi:hypothetical protein